MRIAFIGGGTMGIASIGGLLRQSLVTAQDIRVCDPVAARCDFLSREYGVTIAPSNIKVIEGAQVVVLAIKPQDLAAVMAELRGHLAPEQVVLSIVAGATTLTLRDGLEHDRIVRAMPNTPAQIGEGVTIWTATNEVTAKERERVAAILGALGREIFVADEKYLDMATALSGSGPAYVLLVIEAFIDAGVHLGLPRDLATRMVVETVLGTARLVQETGQHPAELKNMVTSPGGTTAEGLHQLEAGGLRAVIARAVLAGYEKAKRLGGAGGK